MFANFKKNEFREWIMLYLLDELQIYRSTSGETMNESEPGWNRFITSLEEKQLLTILYQNKVNFSMYTKTFGKKTVEGLKKIDLEDQVKMMF